MMSDERTPLINNSSGTDQSPARWGSGFGFTNGIKNPRRTIKIYGLIMAFFLVVGSYSIWMQAQMPVPLSDVEAARSDGFAGSHAYNEYLTQFYTPHPSNSRENGRIKNWLASTLEEFKVKAKANGIDMDLVTDDPTKITLPQDWFTKGERWVVDSRNVIARLHGSDPELAKQSIMVNAHYDSVPTSNGVTDNGMGVAVTLELLRYYVDHPPKHTLIFLLNNMEEGGLIGGYIFTKHPWFEAVKTFINLEGGGAGGRSILVRSNTLYGVAKYASSGAHYLHASPLGNDMMKSKVMKSDTDYTAFDQAGLPGLDIAFYAPRSHYHTQRDTIAYTSPSSVQHMGEMAMGTLRALDDGGAMQKDMYEPVVYYDILGRFVIVMSFGTYQLIHVLALVLVPLIAIGWTMKNEKDHRGEYAAALKELAYATVQGILLVLTAFITAFISIGAASALLYFINPMVTYGAIHNVCLYMILAAFTGLIGSLVLCDKCSWYKQNLEKNPQILLHGLNGFWWLFVLLATYLGTKEMAALYFAIYYLVFNSLASAAFVLLSKDNKYRLPLVFLLQWTVPFLFVIQIADLTMTSLRHAIVDGTPEAAVYILLSVALIFGILPLLFWIQLAGNQRSVLKVSSTLLLIMLLVCFFQTPFDSGLSPKKIVYRQEYNATAPTSRVIVRSLKTQDTLTKLLNTEELASLDCHPFADLPSLQECTYETPLVPVYGKLGIGKEAEITQNKTCDDDGLCTLQGTYSSRNSLFCRISINENANSVTKAYINGGSAVNDDDEKPITALLAYTNAYHTKVPFSITWPATSPTPRGRFNCFYDEWTRGEIPAYVSLRDRLPADNLLLIRGQGMVNVDFESLDF